MESNITVDLPDTRSIGLVQDMGCCERGNEPSGSIKCSDFLDLLRKCSVDVLKYMIKSTVVVFAAKAFMKWIQGRADDTK
jgi:hypothetical protein